VRTPLRFDLNGVSVEVDIPASAARDAIAARFDRCPPAPPGDADVSFVVRTGSGTGRPEGRGRPVYPWDVGEVTYFDGPRSLYISVGDHTRLLAEPASGRVEITTHAAMLDAAWLLARPLLTLPLVELLKWRGRFSLHAAGVVIADRALLLAGPSGSGKSTLALALARDRLDFMADDMVFLTQDGPGVRVHPFPEEVDVSVETAAWFCADALM